MNDSVNLKKIKIGGGLIAAVLLYLYFSTPENVVVDEHGNINGFINNARELIQGKAFWKNQLSEVNFEIEWQLGKPQRMAELQHRMQIMDEKEDQIMEEFDQKYPDMRPSEAERQAEALREMADQIEQQESERFFENLRIERISELRKILPVVKARAE